MGANLDITEKLQNYINDFGLNLHPVQKEIIDYNKTLGDIKRMQIDPTQCHFLHLIIKVSNIKNVLELGIGSIDKDNQYNMNMLGKKYKPGASLRVWRDYFKNAKIYGADIDPKTLFKEKRINTTFVDQSSPKSILKMFKKFKVKKYDIIIDDGCHRYEETINFFKNSFNKLANNGIYIIEDIVPSQRKKFLIFFKSTKYQVKLINFYRPNKNILSNCIITIRKN